MNFRRIIPAFVLSLVALFTFLALRADPQTNPDKFEAHEFALFRSTYESLRIQNSKARAEHLRTLSERTETSTLTQGMTEALVEFCQTVLASKEETNDVKAEAKAALIALETRLTAKTDNTTGRRPASVSPEAVPKR